MDRRPPPDNPRSPWHLFCSLRCHSHSTSQAHVSMRVGPTPCTPPSRTCVRVEQAIARAPLQHRRQLPREVVRVAHAGVHPERACKSKAEGRVKVASNSATARIKPLVHLHNGHTLRSSSSGGGGGGDGGGATCRLQQQRSTAAGLGPPAGSPEGGNACAASPTKNTRPLR